MTHCSWVPSKMLCIWDLEKKCCGFGTKNADQVLHFHLLEGEIKSAAFLGLKTSSGGWFGVSKAQLCVSNALKKTKSVSPAFSVLEIKD